MLEEAEDNGQQTAVRLMCIPGAASPAATLRERILG